MVKVVMEANIRNSEAIKWGWMSYNTTPQLSIQVWVRLMRHFYKMDARR